MSPCPSAPTVVLVCRPWHRHVHILIIGIVARNLPIGMLRSKMPRHPVWKPCFCIVRHGVGAPMQYYLITIGTMGRYFYLLACPIKLFSYRWGMRNMSFPLVVQTRGKQHNKTSCYKNLMHFNYLKDNSFITASPIQKFYFAIICFNSLTPVTMNPMMNITIQSNKGSD